MGNIDVVACLNSGFVMTTGVMMCSVCVNNPDTEIVFHLLVDKSVTEEDKNKLTKTANGFDGKKVVFYYGNNNSLKIFEKKSKNIDRLTLATFYRLSIAEILPHNIHKVLYLDGDVIVRHSLLPLWNTNLNRIPIAAAYDSLASNGDLYKRLGYPYEDGYYNAGVLLINLDYWREYKAFKMFVDHIMTVKEIPLLGDQDILNPVFHSNILLLSLKYNLTSGFLAPWIKLHEKISQEELQEAIKDPVIVHYTIGKPWLRWFNNPDTHPYASTFFKYQQQTCWKDWPIEDRRPMGMRLRHFIANLLRKMKLKSPVPCIYIDLPPID